MKTFIAKVEGIVIGVLIYHAALVTLMFYINSKDNFTDGKNKPVSYNSYVKKKTDPENRRPIGFKLD